MIHTNKNQNRVEDPDSYLISAPTSNKYPQTTIKWILKKMNPKLHKDEKVLLMDGSYVASNRR